MEQQQRRSLAEEYGLKPADSKRPPPTPPPSPSVQKSEEDPAGGEGREIEQEAADEEECGFCLFMKGGGCKESFIAWENCMKEAETKNEDLVEKCYKVTGRLMECMQEHADYYEPILKAEKAMKEEVARGLEREDDKGPED